ncbi:Bug family tripartite tricarboxylate transporter substrate binding protein [Hoeflea poritis]|uniref:Tripartite tricarboxylate transporter substrate binding protein n=1 Tax=Hoeflea poritis TaxID=2993659 RepID=A0ABT4VVJ4_9HYPH|nr:tripartite tricarboxylate transporter substrate binding protein [Hoeflea poritis]MDA4848713.1 tripartite tricarboxylate transporter substrate binding protein [Hoeflea poritis]
MKFLIKPLALGLAAALTMTISAAAQEYPSKPITVVFPNKAGGSYHTFALSFLELLKDKIPQSIGVQAMPGAGTSAGTRHVISQPADGYTLLYIHNAILMTSKFGMLDIGGTDWDAFAGAIEPLAQTHDATNVLYTRADAPYSTAAELADYARANPGKVNAAVSTGTASHLMMGGLADSLGAEINFVHTGGGGAGFRQALLSGDIDITNLDPGGAIKELVEKGLVKPLSVNADTRHPKAPDITSLAEQGIEPPVVMKLQGYFWIHPDTPEEIKQYWRDVLRETLTDPANVAELQSRLGITMAYEDGNALTELVKERYNATAAAIDKFGIKVN